ncbi:MAG TPA: response regulator transcription factor [Nitrospira sp.]|nr:response regulator transcription factor [Nitrospira sp.]
MKQLRLLLADDHVVLLDAFARLLKDDYDVVGTACNGQELVSEGIRLKPDVVIVDLAMPLLDGLNAVTELKKFLPQAKFVVLTASEDPDLAARALAAGAAGYLLKSCAASEVFRALSLIRTGQRYVTPSLAERLDEMAMTRQKSRSAHRELTPRQRQVLQLLAQGQSMKQVAATLRLTPRTVAFHKYQVMDQFRLKSTADLIHFAIRERVISPT